MTLYTSFRSELIKTKKSSTRLLTILGAAVVPVMLVFTLNNSHGVEKLQGNPWLEYFRQAHLYTLGIFLPFFVILLCTLTAQIEHRNNAWKQVMSSPQYFLAIFFSKFLVVQAFIIYFILLSNLFMIASGFILTFLEPKIRFLDYAPAWNRLVHFDLQSYLLVLAMSVIQFGMGIKLKNFILPIVTGFGLWIITIILAQFLPELLKYFPYAYPFVGAISDFKLLLPQALWASVSYSVLFLVVFYTSFALGKEKG